MPQLRCQMSQTNIPWESAGSLQTKPSWWFCWDRTSYLCWETFKNILEREGTREDMVFIIISSVNIQNYLCILLLFRDTSDLYCYAVFYTTSYTNIVTHSFYKAENSVNREVTWRTLSVNFTSPKFIQSKQSFIYWKPGFGSCFGSGTRTARDLKLG